MILGEFARNRYGDKERERERERKSNRERETVSVSEYERINAFFYSCTIIE